MSPRSQRRRSAIYVFALFLLLLVLHFSIAKAAEVGYGPLFDPCGDNCQTQMVNFCTVGHDTAQMRICWCDEAEYIKRMDACLDSCDPAVSDKAVQRDQMLRYRSIVCEPSAITKDVAFQQYYKTRFASVPGGGFVPEVTRGIPPPTASPVDITTSAEGSMAPTLRPSSSSSSSNTDSRPSFFSTRPISITTITVSVTPTASSFVTALPSTAAGPIWQNNGLSTMQLVGIILGTAVASVLLSLSVVFYIRRRNPRRPFWNPPPPPPLPRPSPTSFLPYYTPTSPPATMLPQHIHDMEPHAITTSTSSIHNAGDGESSAISPSRGRGRYSYFPRESPAPPRSQQPRSYDTPSSVSTRLLTPVVTPTLSTIQVSSSSAIAAAAAAERNSRGSTHTLIEPEEQQVILQGVMVDRSGSRSRSRSTPRNGGRRRVNLDESEYCGEDDCTASCSSWSERSWYDEDDAWWDLRESQVMEP